MKHCLSNVNIEMKTAICKHCGPTRIRVNKGKAMRCVGQEKDTQQSASWKVTRSRCNWRARLGREFSKEEAIRLLAIEHCQCCGGHTKDIGSLHLDHCHDKQVVRGMLCRSCNLGIGHFYNSPTKLAQAIEYLSRPALLP
jgi:tRNA G26 N,N-dimethylase Trm1